MAESMVGGTLKSPPKDDVAMKLKLWPSPHMAKEAVLTPRPASVCLDKAFVLIEGHLPTPYPGSNSLLTPLRADCTTGRYWPSLFSTRSALNSSAYLKQTNFTPFSLHS